VIVVLSKLAKDGGHLLIAMFSFSFPGCEMDVFYGWKPHVAKQEQVNSWGVPGLASARHRAAKRSMNPVLL